MGRGGRVLLRHAAAARWPGHAAQGSFHGGIAATVRDDRRGEVSAGAECRASSSTSSARLRRMPELRGQHSCDRPGPFWGGERGILPWSTRTGCGGFSRGCWMKTNSLSPYGIRALSRYHAEHPYVF